MKKVKSFKSTRTSIRIIGTRNWQQLRDCSCLTMEENESLEDDVHSFVDTTSHLTTAVLRRCVEMSIEKQPYLHRPQRDLLSYATVLRQCLESVRMTRTNREV